MLHIVADALLSEFVRFQSYLSAVLVRRTGIDIHLPLRMLMTRSTKAIILLRIGIEYAHDNGPTTLYESYTRKNSLSGTAPQICA